MLVLAEPASIATKKKIVCHFVEWYVSRLYGVQTIQAWLNKNKGLHFFQMFTMSDVAYTLAVIDNGYAAWDKIQEKVHNKAKMKIQQGTVMGTPDVLRENTPVIQAQRDSTAIRAEIKSWASELELAD